MTMLPPKIKGVVRPNEKPKKPVKRSPANTGLYPARGPKDKGGYLGNEGMVH